MDIDIFQLPGDFSISAGPLKNIVLMILNELKLNVQSLSFIFIPDDELAEMHNRYLNDPSKTDVITFNLGDENIEGEIYISTERAFEQAAEFKTTFDNEILRLMIHGLLHLADFNDLDEVDYKKMKEAEDSLLSLAIANIPKT